MCNKHILACARYLLHMKIFDSFKLCFRFNIARKTHAHKVFVFVHRAVALIFNEIFIYIYLNEIKCVRAV